MAYGMDALMGDLNDVKRLRKNVHVWHIHHQDDLIPLFEILKKPKLPYGGLKEVCRRTNIPLGTIKEYRLQLKKDANYKPYQNLGVTTIPRDHESTLAARIREQYLNNDIPVSLGDMQDMAVDLYQSLDAEQVKRDHFSASHSWASRFMRDFHFSLRCGHSGRRGKIDPSFVARFIYKLRKARCNYSHDLIFNMDETCIHTSNPPRFTVATTGADSVPLGQNGIQKECFTCISTITYSGRMLAPWFIGKGTTQAATNCFTQEYEVPENVEIKLGFSHKGWTDSSLMIKYLEWLHEKADKKPCALVLDVFSAHRDQSVKDKANELNIELIFVPANGTSVYQPLDRKVFGVLKSKLMRCWEIARRRKRNSIVWNKKMAADETEKILRNMNETNLLKNAWKNIPELELDIYDEEPLPEVDEDESEDDLEFENDYVYDDYNDDE